MALQTAKVTVKITSLEGLPAATPGVGNIRYARATVQGGTAPVLQTGRTRSIPDAGGSFDLTVEKSPWIYETALDVGGEINIKVQLGEDHGSDAPPPVVEFTGKISDPWAPGVKTLGGGPSIKVTITREVLKGTDKAFLARAAIKPGKGGVLVVPEGYFIEFDGIDGLYRPDPVAVIPAPGSKKVAGYISEDNQGRIFTNRKPDGTWLNDTQFIDVKVKVTAFGGAKIPGGAKIHWTIDNPDDPTNDDSDFHRDWGPWVDTNDYAGGIPQGATPSGNALAFSDGNADEDKLFGTGVGGTARWDTAPGGPAPAPASRMEARSPITKVNPRLGKSSVRVHCTNVTGTNLVLIAGIDGVPASRLIVRARTGLMTMWNRIQVQVVRMASAHSLAGALKDIPQFFEPARVEMDFELETTTALDIKELSPDEDNEEEKSLDWVDNAAVFTNKGRGGWFFLGAAQFASPLPPPGPSPPPLKDTTSYTLGVDAGDPFVEVLGHHPTATFATFIWTDGFGKVQEAGFFVWKVTVEILHSKLYLGANDVVPGFTGHDADGTVEHAYTTQILYFPQHQRPRSAVALAAGGFGVPSAGARVVVDGPGATWTSGISPMPEDPVTTKPTFAGRTVIFTHTPSVSTGSPPVPIASFNADVLSTVVHEFTHAFGMPHKCGFWNWKTPRVGAFAKSCCMNYFNTWLIDPATKNLLPNTVRKEGNDMCGRHLMEVRRVHLQNNKVLGW